MDMSHTQGEIYYNTVPCGRCPLCLKAKINSWLFRLDKELQRSINPQFITLTYNDENLPKQENTDTETGEITEHSTLNKKDLQNFFKRLRKAHDKKFKNAPPIKYYACGEYGTLRGRPHYHIIMFNCQDPDLIQSAWSIDNKPIGHTKTLPLLNGGTTYVLKYMSKPKSKYKNKIPEFALMSKKMGENYLTNYAKKYHLSTPKNTHVTTEQGYKLPMPKYYKEKLFTDDQRKAVTNYLQNRALQKIEDFIALKKRQFPNQDENFYLNLLEQSKNLIKFDERKNEVL